MWVRHISFKPHSLHMCVGTCIYIYILTILVCGYICICMDLHMYVCLYVIFVLPCLCIRTSCTLSFLRIHHTLYKCVGERVQAFLVVYMYKCASESHWYTPHSLTVYVSGWDTRIHATFTVYVCGYIYTCILTLSVRGWDTIIHNTFSHCISM